MSDSPGTDVKDSPPSGPCDKKTLSKGARSRAVKLSESVSSSSSSSDADSVTSDVWLSDANALPPAPDGGWGWFVVLGAFLISLICDGCAFSFGVMYVYLLEEFQQSKSETAWVASIFYCLSLLLGPLASALTTRFGCRTVTCVAGLVSCLGFVTSSFATSVSTLYFTFGVIVGAGFSVCYVTSVITVAYYFEKRRALATGLSVCGTGIGTFTFAPLCEILVEAYGWRGTFLIMGGIALNITVCGALFRPLKFTPEQRRQRALHAFNRLSRTVSRLSIPSRRSRLQSTNSESSSCSTSDSEDEIPEAFSEITLPTYVQMDEEKIRMYLEKLPELRKSTADPQVVLQRFFKSKNCKEKCSPSQTTSPKTDSATVTAAAAARRSQGDVFVDEDSTADGGAKRKKKRKNTKSDTESVQEVSRVLSEKSMQLLTDKLIEQSNQEARNRHGRNHKLKSSTKSDSKLLCKSSLVNSGPVLERSVSQRMPNEVRRKPFPSSRSSGAPPIAATSQNGSTPAADINVLPLNKHSTYLLLHRNDIFFRGSRSNALGYWATSCPELSRLPLESESESEEESCCEVCCPSCCSCPCPAGVRQACKTTFDRRIWCHPLFALFGLSNFLQYFWGDVPYLFAADFAISRGVPTQQATFLISVIGIVNTVGQVFYGFLGDHDWNLTVIYGVSCVGSGIAVLLLPTTSSYWLMAVLCGLYGFFVSANYSLITVMLVEYLGLDKLAHSYGLIMMIQGMANLGGPPLAGWMVDETGGYNVAFPVAGGFIILSGFIVFLLFAVRLCGRLCRCCRLRRIRRPAPSRERKENTTNANNNNAWIGGTPRKEQAMV